MSMKKTCLADFDQNAIFVDCCVLPVVVVADWMEKMRIVAALLSSS